MRTYEMTVILRAADDEFTKGKQLLNELLEKNKVAIVKNVDLSVRMFAYQIKREDKGHYLYFEIQSKPDVIILLERALKLMQPVLKYLIVRKDEEKPVDAKEPVQVSAAKPAEEAVVEAPAEPAAKPAEEAVAEAPAEPAAAPVEEAVAETSAEPEAEPVEEAEVEPEANPEQEESAEESPKEKA